MRRPLRALGTSQNRNLHPGRAFVLALGGVAVIVFVIAVIVELVIEVTQLKDVRGPRPRWWDGVLVINHVPDLRESKRLPRDRDSSVVAHVRPGSSRIKISFPGLSLTSCLYTSSGNNRDLV